MDEDELAALATLLDVSTTDLERSRFCFCRNLGNFEPCGVDGGDDGEGECLEVLLLLDIVVEAGVVEVVIVVEGEREADLDALELTCYSKTRHPPRSQVSAFLPAHPLVHFSADSAEMHTERQPSPPAAAGVVDLLSKTHVSNTHIYIPCRTKFTSSSRLTKSYDRPDGLA